MHTLTHIIERYGVTGTKLELVIWANFEQNTGTRFEKITGSNCIQIKWTDLEKDNGGKFSQIIETE